MLNAGHTTSIGSIGLERFPFRSNPFPVNGKDHSVGYNDKDEQHFQNKSHQNLLPGKQTYV